MKHDAPIFIIALEITVMGILVVCSIGLFVIQYARTQFERDVVLLQDATPPPTTLPSKLKTESPVAASIPIPTLTPTLSPSPTATPDPRVILSACGTISAPGQYLLTTNLSAATLNDCLTVQASQVTLDCGGNALEGVAFNGYGIAIRPFGLLNEQAPSDVEIRNCSISKFHFGIYAAAGTRLNIHDNDASGNYDDVDAGSRYGRFLGMTEGGGIRLDHVSDSQVVANTTLHQAIGIDVRHSDRVTVRGNTSSGNSAWGISLIRTQNSDVSYNTTADNVRQCTWGAGVIGRGCDAGGIVVQDGSNKNVVWNNQVTGQNGNGIFIKAHALPCGSDNSIIGNTVAGALYNSVELGFCSGNKVNGNTFRDGLDAIWLGFAHNNEIKDNTIVNMKNHGIISSNSHDNTISGNHIVNSNVGLYVASEPYDHTFFSWLPPGDYTAHDNCLCNNRFESNSIAIQLKDSWNNQVTNNDLRGNARGLLLGGKTDGNNMQGNLN